jgi:DNA-binding NtrC family response regulator
MHLPLLSAGESRVTGAREGMPGNAAPTLKETESQAIRRALREARGHRGLAAQALGIDRSTLRRKIRDLVMSHAGCPEEGT